MTSLLLQCGARTLDLSAPVVMGVLNVTPDSFSDGGRHQSPDSLLQHVAEMVTAGAAIIDVGGESTRPGAASVSEQQELERVIPAVEAIAKRFDVVISVDTSTASVMREAAAAGAGMINDVRALERSGALQAAAETDLAVCLMHRQGEPRTMQLEPHYQDVVTEVRDYLLQRADACVAAGILRNRLVMDQGYGFGKNDEHHGALFNAIPQFVALQYPLLVGVSRKSMIGRLLGRELPERVIGSVALALMAAQRGAHILRVHDVRETQDALRLWQWLQASAAH